MRAFSTAKQEPAFAGFLFPETARHGARRSFPQATPTNARFPHSKTRTRLGGFFVSGLAACDRPQLQ
jgi:hypothetical protein